MRYGISTVLSALLFVSAGAQTRQTDNPYVPLIREAQQLIVHVPQISDPNLVNALKVAGNLSVPMRIITTDDGLMQQNGFALTLIVLGLPVYQVPGGGDRRMFMEVEGPSGWNVYDLSEGRPVRRNMLDYGQFNSWYGKNAQRLPRYVPEAAVATWTNAYLGYKLTAGGIRFDQSKKRSAVPAPVTTPR